MELLPEKQIGPVLAVFTVSSILSLVFFWILLSYFEIDAANLLVYPGNDAHCLIPTQSLGVHCFGDFASIRYQSLFAGPLPPGDVYPASTRIVLYPFMFVNSLFGFRWAVLSFLAISCVSLLIPIFYVSRGLPLLTKMSFRFFLGFFTLPFIFTLDRGNPIAIAVPGIFFYLLMCLSNRDIPVRTSILFLMLAVSIKPQFIALSFIPLLLQDFKLFLKHFVFGLFTICIPFIIYGRATFREFTEWITTTREWTNSLSLSANYPSNFSIARGLEVLNFDGQTISVTLIFVALISVFLFHMREKGKSVDLVSIAVILISSSLSTPIAYGYYTCVFIPLMSLTVCKNTELFKNTQSLERWIVTCALALTLSPLVIPSGWNVQDSSIYNLAPIFCSIGWSVVLMYAVLRNLKFLSCFGTKDVEIRRNYEY